MQMTPLLRQSSGEIDVPGLVDFSVSIIAFSPLLFIDLSLAALDLHCSTWTLSSCSLRATLIGAQASHCGGFSCCRAGALELQGVSICRIQAQLPRGMWDRGLNPCPLHWPAGPLPLEPPGKSTQCIWLLIEFSKVEFPGHYGSGIPSHHVCFLGFLDKYSFLTCTSRLCLQ